MVQLKEKTNKKFNKLLIKENIPELKGFEDENVKLRLAKNQLGSSGTKSPSPLMNIQI